MTTHSYLFLNDILRQPLEPPGVPCGDEAWNGLPSAYWMDERIVKDPLDRDRLRDSLRTLPLVSIVFKPGDLFGREGLYLNTWQRGREWEKACSTELILPEGTTGFQIDCGIRIQGGMNRDPRRTPKHSFRLIIRNCYSMGLLPEESTLYPRQGLGGRTGATDRELFSEPDRRRVETVASVGAIPAESRVRAPKRVKADGPRCPASQHQPLLSASI